MAPGAAAVATEHQAAEWRVNVPPAGEHDGRRGACCAPPAWLFSWMAAPRDMVSGFAKMVWKVGADDPRRAIHALKVAVALTLCSVFYYVRPLYVFTGQTAMWAVLTVVVVFEYTVGGCLYKGLNRAMATSVGGALALGVHWIASQSSKEVEPFILSGSLFLMAAVGTYSRFIPTMKARFDYGVTIFILTYSLVAVSGYRVHEVVAMAQQRLTTVAIGTAICFAVCAFVFPVWAGQELHALVARNMDKLAASVEGCVDDYFSSSAVSERSRGYRFALNAKASEDSLANLARWEPAHGRFGFRHPYFHYQRVGAAMRCAACCVDALAACAGAEAQPPPHAKKRLAGACAALGRRCAAVLREASGSVAAMAWSGRLALAAGEMNAAAEELRGELRCLAATLEEEEEETESAASLIEVLPLFTAASLLLEVCARAEGVVGAVEALATTARFKKADHAEEKTTTLDIEAGAPVVSVSDPISAEAHLKVAVVDPEKTTEQANEPRDQVGQLVKMLLRRPSGKKWMRGEPNKVCPKPPKDMTIQVPSPRNRSMEFATVAPNPRSRAAELASPRNRALELAGHAAVAASSPRHRSVEFASHAPVVAASPRHRSMDFAIHGPVVPSPRINRSMELVGAQVPSPRNRSILGMA